MSDKLEVKIRDAGKDDWAFIMSAWRKSYRDVEAWVPAYVYNPQVLKEIESFRARGARFRMAVDPEADDFIWGFACTEGGAVHYVYVKESARGQGVAKKLVGDAGLSLPVTLTYWTKFAEQIQRKKPGSMMYEPSRRKAHDQNTHR